MSQQDCEAHTLKKITVFYAWQSDRPQRFNRHLVRIALEVAAKRITADPGVDADVRIDSDTQGVPGQPPSTDTILKKIKSSDIFVPDLTFVTCTDGGKLIPNPNVSIEYGYALHAKPYTAVMSIMNTAYGAPENLPFDIGHVRHPIQYYVEPTAKNAERRKQRDALFVKVEAALRLMINDQIDKWRHDNLFPEAIPNHRPAFFSKAGEAIATFGYPTEQEYCIKRDRAVYIRVFPKYGDQPRVGFSKIKTIFDAKKPCAMSLTIGGLASRNAYGSIIIDPIGSNITEAVTQGFATGELWGINSQCFRELERSNFDQKPRPQRYFVIASITLEKILVKAVENYIRIVNAELHLKPPYVVEMGAVGVKGCYLTAPGGHFGRGQEFGPIMDDIFRKRCEITNIDKNSILTILREYLINFYDLAACSREAVLTDELVAAHGLPPL